MNSLEPFQGLGFVNPKWNIRHPKLVLAYPNGDWSWSLSDRSGVMTKVG